MQLFLQLHSKSNSIVEAEVISSYMLFEKAFPSLKKVWTSRTVSPDRDATMMLMRGEAFGTR